MRRSFMLSIAAVAILAVLCSGASFAATEDGVRYLDANGELKTQDGVTVIESGTTTYDQEWLLVKGHTKFTDMLGFTSITGANIILEDGATLDVSVKPASANDRAIVATSLTIYAQSTDRAKMGVISADVTRTAPGDPATIDVAGSLTIQGGIVKARADNTAHGNVLALKTSANIIVGADAVVEASSFGKFAVPINAGGDFVSSGEVTATAFGTDTAIAILPHADVKLVGGVCSATATIPSSSSGSAAGISAPGTVSIEGGWVESRPPIILISGGTKTHSGGVLIDGDTGTVKGDAVIPAGMTATLREGVTMTVEPGAKIVNDGELVLPASMTKEQIKSLNITGNGEIFKGTEPIHADGAKSYDGAISAASQMFGESSPWTPASGDWEIVISMDSTVDIDGVSIDGESLTKDDEWSIKAASLGGISPKAETPRTVVISAETLSGLVDETASKDHTLRITMTDDGYAIMTFWVGKAVPSEDDDPTVPTRHSSGGACATGSGLAAIVGLAVLAMIERRAR